MLNNTNKSAKDITAIILTYNEEKHIERCILSIREFVKKITIIDSFSSDDTINIAKKYNVEIHQNKFVNHSKQINWGLKNIKFNTEWMIRVDADEYLTHELKQKVSEKLKINSEEISGISVNWKIRFLNKYINFGGASPHASLRIWKTGKGKCSDLWQDEQIEVSGDVFHINEALIDHNLNNLSWWVKKHKTYAVREAINFLITKDESKLLVKPSADESKIKKYYKMKVYYKLPIFIRPFLLFFYNYFLKLGFLSSWQGLIFYFYQVLWFRFLVDVNINQLKTKVMSK